MTPRRRLRILRAVTVVYAVGLALVLIGAALDGDWSPSVVSAVIVPALLALNLWATQRVRREAEATDG